MVTETTNCSKRTIKYTKQLLVWTVAWIGTLIFIDKAELYQWYSSVTLSIIGIAVNTAIGLGLIFVFIRYLNAIDELQRKIQLDALAFAMGIGFIGGVCYSSLATSGFIVDAEASDVLMLMALTYTAGVIFGQVKYQ